jgi:phosphatidate cytidylyltransferase
MNRSLAQRLIVVIILLPIGAFLVYKGGWYMVAMAAAIGGFGAWEYWRLFTRGGFHPSAPGMISGVLMLILFRQLFGFSHSDLLIGLYILVAMGAAVLKYERGDNTSAVDFNITLGGILYLGWLTAYFISLRNLPDGMWWFIIVLPPIWVSDGAAFFVGRKYGRHKMSQRTSPNKSWEGYIGGLIGGALFAWLMAYLAHVSAPAIMPISGLILGLVISAIAPLGDLGESLLKRCFGVKDSSNLLPGHGGVLDRVDTWLWAAVIGYYMILHVLG